MIKKTILKKLIPETIHIVVVKAAESTIEYLDQVFVAIQTIKK